MDWPNINEGKTNYLEMKLTDRRMDSMKMKAKDYRMHCFEWVDQFEHLGIIITTKS